MLLISCLVGYDVTVLVFGCVCGCGLCICGLCWCVCLFVGYLWLRFVLVLIVSIYVGLIVASVGSFLVGLGVNDCWCCGVMALCW